jgi:hypothetical protein
MRHVAVAAGIAGVLALSASLEARAENWIQNFNDKKGIEATYHDADSVKVVDKTLRWTEKTVIAADRIKPYNKHLSTYQACRDAIAKKGEATQHQIDYEIKGGQFRRLAKRNYNKANELICTDADMGNDYDKSWHRIARRSPMEETYFHLVTRYKLPDL